MTNKPRTIALFGGAFDPPHLGHEGIIRSLAEQPFIDAIQIIPYHESAFGKTPHASARDRIEMLRLLIKDKNQCTINHHEVQHTGPNYTIDTLAHIQSQHPEARLFWVLSTESLATFNAWKNPEGILAITHLICYTRSGTLKIPEALQARVTETTDDLLNTQSGKIWIAPTPLAPWASSSIREAIMKDRSSIEGLNPKVTAYIHQHQLYQEDTP